MKLNLEYQLTQEDYFDFTYYATWIAQWNKRKRIIYYSRIIILCIAIIIFFHFTGKPLTSTFLIIYSVFLCIYIFLVVPFWIKSNYKRVARKFFKDEKNVIFFSKSNLEINESGIFSSDQHTSAHFRWSSVVKYAENEKLYMVFVSDSNAIIIPKRIISSSGNKEILTTIFQQNIPLQVQLHNKF